MDQMGCFANDNDDDDDNDDDYRYIRWLFYICTPATKDTVFRLL
jgi:hypothetical protein